MRDARMVAAQLCAECDTRTMSGEPLAMLTRRELAAAAVPGAARVSGGRADAVVVIDDGEHARRTAVGLGAVADYSTLYALMCLPVDAPVPVADLGEVTRRLLGKAPVGCVDWLDTTHVRRRYVPAATAPLVVIRGATWRPALRRAAVFEPFATRVVLLTRAPRRVADIAWEADIDGTGLWIAHPDGDVEEIVAPTPWAEHYVKPAGWRFAEQAYAAWLTHHGIDRAVTGPAATNSGADPTGQMMLGDDLSG